MFNKIILIGRLGQNAEAKTAQNNRKYVIINVATHESWKNDQGEYETGAVGAVLILLRRGLARPAESHGRAARAAE